MKKLKTGELIFDFPLFRTTLVRRLMIEAGLSEPVALTAAELAADTLQQRWHCRDLETDPPGPEKLIEGYENGASIAGLARIHALTCAAVREIVKDATPPPPRTEPPARDYWSV